MTEFLGGMGTRAREKAVFGVALAGFLMAGGPAVAADVESIDWSKPQTKNLRLFYPGQSSYEWLRLEDHKKAYAKVREGEACLECHRGEEKSLGKILVVENRLEPEPIEGKVSSIRLAVQAAHDAENLYMRFSWPSSGEGPGNIGNFMRYDGEEWQWYGNHRQHQDVIDDDQPAIAADRLGIMIGDEAVDLFTKQGCWVTCHDSMVGMEEQADWDEVAEHPVLGTMYEQFNIVNELVRKFIPESRSEGTQWDAVKSADELKALRERGAFLDLIIWDASLTGPAGVAADFNILEMKAVDAGRSPLWPNGEMRQGPGFVFDEAKVGYSVLTEDDLADADKIKHLIIGETAKSADGVEFSEGDILPAHILDTGAAEGSAADVSYAKGTHEDGTYTVVIRRKLDTGHPLDDKILEPGKVYTFGFSIHDDAAGKRAHLVSFPIRISIGEGTAELQALTLD